MSDWTPAVLDNITGTQLTFTTDLGTVVRDVGSTMAAMFIIAEVGTRFEFSAELNAVRGKSGEAITLPESEPRRIVDHEHCEIRARGHHLHHFPALRAINNVDSTWEPIEVLEVDGQKVTFATADGMVTGYTHDPERFAGMREFNRTWRVLRDPNRKLCDYSTSPIGPCTA